MIQLRCPRSGKTCASLVCHSAVGCCAPAASPLAINNHMARMALTALILSSFQTLPPLHADSNKGVEADTAVEEERHHIAPRDAVLGLRNPAHQRCKHRAPDNRHHDQRATNLCIPIQPIDAQPED